MLKSNLWQRKITPWKLFIIAILVLGIFLRFVNIDRKVYWHDEALTSLRISGYTRTEVSQQVFNGNDIGIENLQKYLHPNLEKNFNDTLHALAINAEHPPLYYMIARFWVNCFGSSVAEIRSLSVLFSLLVLPCIYWLCCELFQSSLVGGIAMILVAVSPFHILYAQEAREYSFWTWIILLSNITLLRAMRLQTKLSWVIYAVTIVCNLYTSLFSLLVIISHSVYVIAIEGLLLSKKVKAYLLALVFAFLAFTPWLLVILINFKSVHSATDWINSHFSWLKLLEIWAVNSSLIFIDFNLNFENIALFKLFMMIFSIFFIGYSLYFLCRDNFNELHFFLLSLIIFCGFFLIFIDLVLSKNISIHARYLIPFYLGIQLAIAYLLANKIVSSRFSQRLWQVLMLLIISGGILSCIVSTQAETWWTKDNSYNNPQIARTINQAIHPLLISNSTGSDLGNILSLSYLLHQKVRLQLVVDPAIPQISERFSDVFLFGKDTYTEVLRSKIIQEKHYRIEPIYDRLWHLEKY